MTPYRAPLPASAISRSASSEANKEPVTAVCTGTSSSSVSSSARRAAVTHLSSGVAPAESRSSTCAALIPPSARERCRAAAPSAGDRIVATAREKAGDASADSTLPSTRDLSKALYLSDSRTTSVQRPSARRAERFDAMASQRGRSSSTLMLRKRRRTRNFCSSASNSSRARGRAIRRSFGAPRDGLPEGRIPFRDPEAQAARTSKMRNVFSHLAEFSFQ
mmetsp:Transcript_20231/g.40343  ORF Transcript_20231/g.40343 Transcript_20231/m.40343 type:complete len:220 (-) Transcript_20231:199-858(-)